MRRVPSRQAALIKEILLRGLWLLLLIAHARALAGAWQCCGGSGLTLEWMGGCALLTIATLFFSLKLVGVGWPRFCRDRRSFVAICLVLAVIHLDCIHPGMRTTFVSKCGVVLAAIPMTVAVPRMVRAVRTAVARRSPCRKLLLPNGRFGTELVLDAFHPHCWVLASHLFRLRAPPV